MTDMTEQDWTDLIDQYLLGTISPENKSILERRMAAEPGFAEEVWQSRAAYQVIQYERYRRLKSQMLKWDRQSVWPRRWGPLLVILTLLAGLLSWGIWYYAPERLALRYFEDFSSAESVLISKEGPYDIWTQASAAFRSGDFENAIYLYSDFADKTDVRHRDPARWNILLSQLALQGMTPQWKADFDRFMSGTQNPFRDNRIRMQAAVEHPLGRIFIRRFYLRAGGFHPKII